MVTVHRHGNKTRGKFPGTGEITDLVDIIFIERGRGGANLHLSNSSAALSAVLGKNVGLETVRTHTQPVRLSEIEDFPVGKKLQLFINRTLYSEPAMKQQDGRAARRIDGRPTFFVTELSETPQADIDKRESNEVLSRYNPGLLGNTEIGGIQMEVLEIAEPVETATKATAKQTQDEVVHEPLK